MWQRTLQPQIEQPVNECNKYTGVTAIVALKYEMKKGYYRYIPILSFIGGNGGEDSSC